MRIYELLRLLAILGWREKLHIGRYRVLVHPGRPGVQITVNGRPTDPVTPEELTRIMVLAGVLEGTK